MSEMTCPMCEMRELATHPAHHECLTCGHEWPLAQETEEAAGEQVVKDAYGDKVGA